MQSFSMSFHIAFQNETLTTMTVEMFLCAVYSLTRLFKLICPMNAFPQTKHTKQFGPDCIIRISHTVPSVSERLLTCCTFVCFVTTINARMKVKCGFNNKTFVTQRTLVGMIIGTYPRMFSLGPFIVQMWFPSRKCSHMSIKIWTCC
jgi:hypothetical protein